MVFFKLQLVMFFEGLRSERKLIETASLNLAHRWYLGYALDENNRALITPEMEANLEDAKAKIISGELEVSPYKPQ